jgi:hypothetical protein
MTKCVTLSETLFNVSHFEEIKTMITSSLGHDRVLRTVSTGNRWLQRLLAIPLILIASILWIVVLTAMSGIFNDIGVKPLMIMLLTAPVAYVISTIAISLVRGHGVPKLCLRLFVLSIWVLLLVCTAGMAWSWWTGGNVSGVEVVSVIVLCGCFISTMKQTWRAIE